jgi:hypothetical protein
LCSLFFELIIFFLESLEILALLINFGFQIKESDLQLALESGDSQVWLLLKNKLQERSVENQQKEWVDEQFLSMRNENEALKRKIQEYEVY